MLHKNTIFKTSIFALILIFISSYSHSKVLDFNKDAKNISNYFSGSVAFNNFDYEESKSYLDKFGKSEKNNKFSSTFLQSLINSDNYMTYLLNISLLITL